MDAGSIDAAEARILPDENNSYHESAAGKRDRLACS